MPKIPDSVQFFESLVKKVPPAKRPPGFQGANYIGGGQSNLIYLDLPTPKLRELYKLASPKDLSSNQQLDFFEKLWFGSKIFEAKAISLYWLQDQPIESLLQWTPRLLSWSAEIDNWALSDWLCYNYARILEQRPQLILPTYKRWNRHKNPWLRRISMVGLFYYSRQRKKQPSFHLAISLIDPHLGAPEHYVQKAVGWSLRESYNVYPRQTLIYLEKNITEISSTAWIAASEKLPTKIKTKLLKLRKKKRSID